MSFNRYYCTICFNIWDNHLHKPRIIPFCKHTFCEKCLLKMVNLEQEQIVCPEDLKITNNIKSIEQFLINTELLLQQHQQQTNYLQENNYQQHLIEESKRVKTEVSDVNISYSNITFKQFFDYNTAFCTKHNLKEEYFCQDHNSSLCLSCISTQQHSNHKIFELGELKFQITEARQQTETTFKIIKEKNRLYEQDMQKSFQDLQNSLMFKKKESIQNIEFKFQDHYHRLRTIENIIVQQINVLAFKVEEHIRLSFSNSQKKIHEALNEFQKRMDTTYSNDQLGQLLSDLTKLPNYGLEQLKIIDFSDEKVRLSSLIKDSLNIEYNEISQEQLERLCVVKQSTSKFASILPTNFKMIKQNNSNGSKKQSEYIQYSKNTHFIEKTHRSRKSDKKSKSLDTRVFERVKILLQEGKNVDKLDISNQEITDEDVNEVCTILMDSKSQIESVKLAKNRITDVGFEKLLKCLSIRKNIHTVNLTGNQCTARSIELIENQMKVSQMHIKNLYLTNCKINANKHREEQQRIIQAGVNLYL